MKSETRTRPIHESRSYRRVSVFRTESISMAIPLKANNTRRLRLRRRRPQELSPWSGSILETSTTWRATYRPKVSSICCRCAMLPPPPPLPRPPSDLESFCCWQFREREQTRSSSTSSLCCHSPRDTTPPQSLPVPPKGIPFIPLFDTSTRFPLSLPPSSPPKERTSEIASGTVPDRIFAASTEISPSGRRVPRYKYLFSRRGKRETSGYEISRGSVSFSKVFLFQSKERKFRPIWEYRFSMKIFFDRWRSELNEIYFVSLESCNSFRSIEII